MVVLWDHMDILYPWWLSLEKAVNCPQPVDKSTEYLLLEYMYLNVTIYGRDFIFSIIISCQLDMQLHE